MTVMRDGRVAGVTRARRAASRAGPAAGRSQPRRAVSAARRQPSAACCCGCDDARFRPKRRSAGWQAPECISLDVHEGEIVGLAGMMGAGRTELLSALYGTGLPGRWEGEVAVGGRAALLDTIAAARRAGLAFVTDDRRGSGLMLRMSVGLNLVMSVIRRMSPHGLMVPRLQDEAMQGVVRAFRHPPAQLRASPSARCPAATSKRWCWPRSCSPIRACCCSTSQRRGVDVGAKGEIYARLRELAAKGLGILVASSEMPELIGLCDRVVVLRQGRSVAEFAGAGLDEHTVMAAANSMEG